VSRTTEAERFVDRAVALADEVETVDKTVRVEVRVDGRMVVSVTRVEQDEDDSRPDNLKGGRPDG